MVFNIIKLFAKRWSHENISELIGTKLKCTENCNVLPFTFPTHSLEFFLSILFDKPLHKETEINCYTFVVSPRAGRLVTKRLMEDLGSKDFTATQKAKEQFCQLLENPDAVQSRRKYSFKTVDGASYTLTGEEYTSPEVLFRLSGPEEGISHFTFSFSWFMTFSLIFWWFFQNI